MLNNKLKIQKTEILTDNWYTLRKITYDYLKKDGSWQTQSKEAYDQGKTVQQFYSPIDLKNVILTRQFRLPTFVNGNDTGLSIESCASLLDKDNAEDCIKRETEEETDYKISTVKKIFEAYMSGSVTEILHFL